MTLPSELKLVERDGKPLLTSAVVSEIDKIAGAWQPAAATLDVSDAYQLRVTVSLDHNSTITLGNSQGEQFVVDVNASTRTAIVYRNAKSGQTRFSGSFSIPSMRAPLNVEGNEVTIDLFIDQSSIELLSNGGAMSQTTLVFPSSIYRKAEVTGADATIRVRTLKSICNASSMLVGRNTARC